MDFPGGPGVKTLCFPLQGAWVQSLGPWSRKLCMPRRCAPPKGTRLSSLSTQRRGGAAKCLHASYRHKSKACHYLCKVVKFWPNSHLKSSQSILALDQQEKNFFQMTEKFGRIGWGGAVVRIGGREECMCRKNTRLCSSHGPLTSLTR